MFRFLFVLAAVCCTSAFRFQRPRIARVAFDSLVGEGEASGAPVKKQVFIGNLPFEISEDAVQSILSEKLSKSFKSFRLATDKRSGRSRGFGYVDFEEPGDAEAAAAELSGLQVDGRDVKVDVSEPRAPREKTPQENSIFIGNLDFTVTEEQLQDMCDDLLGPGLIEKVRIAIDRATGRPRGFAHVDFKSEGDAIRAVTELNNVNLLGRDIRVDRAQRKAEGAPAGASNTMRRTSGGRQFSIFLGNLAWDVTQEMVEDMLNDVLGPNLFLAVRLAYERETGRPRGFCHIDFKDAETAERAIVELSGMEVLGRQLKADHAQRKE